MATAGELRCYDSAIESDLEDIDSAFILKEEQRNAIKAFVDGKYVCLLRPVTFAVQQKVWPVDSGSPLDQVLCIRASAGLICRILCRPNLLPL